MKLSALQTKRVFPTLPSAKAVSYTPLLKAAMQEGRITTRRRAVAFLAQLGHESGDLKHLREIWGPTKAQLGYDTRTDLGNTPERDGDGEKYKGRGGIQRTGRDNYERAQEELGLPLLAHPELLEKPENAFRSDVLFWTDKKLNPLADKLTLRGDAKDLSQFDKITKRINGGYNGRFDRQARYLEVIDVLPEELFAPTTIASVPPAETKPPGEVMIAPPQTETPAQPGADSDDDLLAKLSANNTAKVAGTAAAKRVGIRLGRPFALLLAALQAGNFYAWLGLLIFLLGIAVLIYFERQEIARGGRWIWSRVRSLL